MLKACVLSNDAYVLQSTIYCLGSALAYLISLASFVYVFLILKVYVINYILNGAVLNVPLWYAVMVMPRSYPFRGSVEGRASFIPFNGASLSVAPSKGITDINGALPFTEPRKGRRLLGMCGIVASPLRHTIKGI